MGSCWMGIKKTKHIESEADTQHNKQHTLLLFFNNHKKTKNKRGVNVPAVLISWQQQQQQHSMTPVLTDRTCT